MVKDGVAQSLFRMSKWPLRSVRMWSSTFLKSNKFNRCAKYSGDKKVSRSRVASALLSQHHHPSLLLAIVTATLRPAANEQRTSLPKQRSIGLQQPHIELTTQP